LLERNAGCGQQERAKRLAESDSNRGIADTGEESLGAALARGVCRALHHRGAATLTEFTLRSGRRADVIAVADDGRVTIVEVKASVADFRADGKWPEYRDYCDYFYFAVPEDFPRELLPDDCGIMVADPYDALVLRPAEEAPINANRRRTLILRIARTAAQRLSAWTDPRNGT
jgi:hypothetical protein